MINRDLLETGRTDEQNARKERQRKTDRKTDEGRKEPPQMHNNCPAFS